MPRQKNPSKKKPSKTKPSIMRRAWELAKNTKAAAGKVRTAAEEISNSEVGKTVSKIHSYTSLSGLSRKAARAAKKVYDERKNKGKPAKTNFAEPRLRF